MEKIRCNWCLSSPTYINYHDHEWGVPCYDDQKLFEFLILEGMQAGLSWITVLNKRSAMKEAFKDFNVHALAHVDDSYLLSLLENPKIIRNRLKIFSVRQNAQAVLNLQERKIYLNEFLWSFVSNEPVQNQWHNLNEVPAKNHQSDAMAKELKKLGFNFVGTTICYALMQAVGMVNDHLTTCFRHQELLKSSAN